MNMIVNGVDLSALGENKCIKAEIRRLDGKLELGIMTGGYYCSQEWTYYPINELSPHGRLGDLDLLWEQVYEAWEIDADAGECSVLMELIRNAKTVAPAYPPKDVPDTNVAKTDDDWIEGRLIDDLREYSCPKCDWKTFLPFGPPMYCEKCGWKKDGEPF